MSRIFVSGGSGSSVISTGGESLFGGFSVLMNFSSSTGTPASGELILNNASPMSATVLRISDIDTASMSIDSPQDTMSNGLFRIYSVSNPLENVLYGVITTVGDSGTYHAYQITPYSMVGSFTNGEQVVFTFAAKGETGSGGATGAQGDKGGLRYVFSTTTDTTVDPGNGSIRFNNSTVASVTEISIDDLTTQNTDISDYILTWDDSTNSLKGHIIIQGNVNSDATYCIFAVSALINEAGWTRLTVTHVSGNAPTNGESLVVNFHRTGNVGASGNDTTLGVFRGKWYFETAYGVPGTTDYFGLDTDPISATKAYIRDSDIPNTIGDSQLDNWKAPGIISFLGILNPASDFLIGKITVNHDMGSHHEFTFERLAGSSLFIGGLGDEFIIQYYPLYPFGINDLTDVTISGVQDGQFLRYFSVSGQWYNTTVASLGGSDVPYVSTDPPPTPEDGTLWWDTDDITTCSGTLSSSYDFGFSIDGKPNIAEILVYIPMVRAVVFDNNFSGSYGKAMIASTGNAIFTISKNTTQIGTVTFSGSNTGVFSSDPGMHQFAVGDILKIQAPGTQDTTLSTLGIMLKGSKL